AVWAGGQIDSSLVAAANASQAKISYSIGYADGADGPAVTTLSSGEIEILPTIAGDAKLLGNVVFGDFQILAEYFGRSGGWDEGNFTYGPTIDFGDFQLLAQDFGAGSSALTESELAAMNAFAEEFGESLIAPSGGGFQAEPIPEPAAGIAATIALAGILGGGRRRR
ncbi:MAG TPA: hypothetical protein VL992_07280, partial [Tepidisphaeraceae bacterium]|nr:hypothetical protein [Tepidisphaeraceae bacterium]